MRLNSALGQWSTGQSQEQKQILGHMWTADLEGERVTVMIGAEAEIYLATSESVFEFLVWTYKLIHQIKFELWHSSSQDFSIILKQNLFGNQHFFILLGMSSEYKSLLNWVWNEFHLNIELIENLASEYFSIDFTLLSWNFILARGLILVINTGNGGGSVESSDNGKHGWWSAWKFSPLL